MDKPIIIISRHGLYLPTSSGLSRISNLSELANKFGNKKLEIFVAPNLSYLENITFPSDKTITDDDVKHILATKIPDEISHSAWSIETASRSEAQKQMIVFALETDFFSEFMTVLAEQKISVSGYSSLALAVVNQVTSDQPYVIIFVQSDIIFLVAKINNKVYSHPVEQLNNLKSELAQFITTLESNQNIRIASLYDCSDRSLASLGLSIKNLSVNFAKLKPSCVIDSRAISKLAFTAGQVKQPTNKISRPANLGQLPKLFFFLALSLMLFGIVWWWRFGQAKQPTDQIASPTPTPMVTVPSPTPESINPQTVAVTILNGTTTKGYANEIADVLKTAGYSQIKTGNDTTENYTQDTLVTNDPALQEAIAKLLVNLKFDFVSEPNPDTTATKSATIYLEVPKSDL